MKSTLVIAALLFGLVNTQAQSSFTCNFTDTVNSGPNNSTIIFSGSCTNNDCCNSINITQIIISGSLPAGWSITMCNPNGCFGNGVDTNAFILGGSGSGNVYFEIHTGANPGTGTAIVRFENTANKGDHTQFTITATAPGTTGITQVRVEKTPLSQNHPNPFTTSTAIDYALAGSSGRLVITDITGKTVRQYMLSSKTDHINLTESLEAGNYFYSLWDNGTIIETKKMTVVN